MISPDFTMIWRGVTPPLGLLVLLCIYVLAAWMYARRVSEPSITYRLLRYLWWGSGKRLLDTIGAITRVLRNILMWTVGRSDYKRWSSAQGLEAWWDQRTRVLAELVPAGSRVIEFGAGRRQLEKLLPPTCTYTPSDLVDRGVGTIVCDLNHRPLPDLSQVAADVTVFGGVLEYVRDVPALIQWLSQAGVKTCVASFDPMPAQLGLPGRYREFLRRRYYGYMNNLTEAELLSSFEAVGFACTHRQPWTSQVILVFCHFVSIGSSAL